MLFDERRQRLRQGKHISLVDATEAEYMVGPRAYESQFKNRYGEEWQFHYCPATGEAAFRGVDVDWRECRVVRCVVPELVLNEEEMTWLRAAWAEPASRQ